MLFFGLMSLKNRKFAGAAYYLCYHQILKRDFTEIILENCRIKVKENY